MFIRVVESDGLAVLYLDRPPLNVLSIAMLREISNALADLKHNTTARALLIRGEGKCFSAGMDVSDHLPGKVEDMISAMHEMFEHLSQLEIPTVSAVHGSAMGGGLELAVSTDLTFAAADAKLAVPEIRLGVFPPVAIASFANKIGPKLTYEMVLTGRAISADEAVRCGLINAAFPPADFEARVGEAVRALTTLSRPVLIAAKKALLIAEDRSLKDALTEVERIYLQELMSTSDAVEGLRAFLEKRPPRWKHK